MYTAEQISELIQALRKCKEAACNSCKYECCQDITVDAAMPMTYICRAVCPELEETP